MAGWEHFSTLTVSVEVYHDGSPDDLAEDMATIVRRALRDRGLDVEGWDHDHHQNPAGVLHR